MTKGEVPMNDSPFLRHVYGRTRELAASMTTERLLGRKRSLHRSLYWRNRWNEPQAIERRQLNAVKAELRERGVIA